ncbi:hypothetical protein LNP74_25080 [Klebsiella pneumoniae subsp. pneumoniae]|nr:hypothetical protein [Klebsiella pneumoniae subsp. pneumoniae]
MEITEQGRCYQRGGCGLNTIYTPAGFPSLDNRLFRAFLSPRAGFIYIQNRSEFCRPGNREAPTNKLLDCVIEMARTLSLRMPGVEADPTGLS